MTGGSPLHGEVQIAGAKNAALPILCACLLSSDTIELHNVPDLQDVRTMLKLLQQMGVMVDFPDPNDRSHLCLNAGKIISPEAPYELVKTMRASILVLGPLLARMGLATVSLPGGCAIGARPVDQHIKGLKAMGAGIQIRKGFIVAKIAEGKPGAGTFAQPETIRNESDEFAPTRTFRQPGLVDTLSFRVRFVGTTATLRTFVNKVRNSGRPFAVTAVEVSTPSADTLKLLGATSTVVSASAPTAAVPVTSLPGFFTADAAAASNSKAAAPAPKEERKVVIRQAPAQFSIQIDYLTVVEDKPAVEGEPKK